VWSSVTERRHVDLSHGCGRYRDRSATLSYQAATTHRVSHDALRFEMDRLISHDEASLLDEVSRVVALLPDGPITRKAFDDLARCAALEAGSRP
jgi:hypothetical protein